MTVEEGESTAGKKKGVAIYSPLLEGVLSVQPNMVKAVKFIREYSRENPDELLRVIRNYPY